MSSPRWRHHLLSAVRLLGLRSLKQPFAYANPPRLNARQCPQEHSCSAGHVRKPRASSYLASLLVFLEFLFPTSRPSFSACEPIRARKQCLASVRLPFIGGGGGGGLWTLVERLGSAIVSAPVQREPRPDNDRVKVIRKHMPLPARIFQPVSECRVSGGAN